MRPWNQSQFLLHEDPTGSGPVVYAFRTADSGGMLGFASSVPSETILERVLGCYVLATMPEKALKETLVLLRDTLEFYREETAIPAQVTRRTYTSQAPIAKRTKRPDLVIEE